MYVYEQIEDKEVGKVLPLTDIRLWRHLHVMHWLKNEEKNYTWHQDDTAGRCMKNWNRKK